jgi:hypothetical protein
VLAAPGTCPVKDTPADGQARKESPSATRHQPGRTRPKTRPVSASSYSQARNGHDSKTGWGLGGGSAGRDDQHAGVEATGFALEISGPDRGKRRNCLTTYRLNCGDAGGPLTGPQSGLIIVDECHHVPAAAFEHVVRPSRLSDRSVVLHRARFRLPALDTQGVGKVIVDGGSGGDTPLMHG